MKGLIAKDKWIFLHLYILHEAYLLKLLNFFSLLMFIVYVLLQNIDKSVIAKQTLTCKLPYLFFWNNVNVCASRQHSY